MQALLNVPASAPRGDIVDIKVLIRHPMETGFRRDRSGQPVPRDIIHTLWCEYMREEIFRAEIFPAIAANPFFSFTLRAEETANVVVRWIDQSGGQHEKAQVLNVT